MNRSRNEFYWGAILMLTALTIALLLPQAQKQQKPESQSPAIAPKVHFLYPNGHLAQKGSHVWVGNTKVSVVEDAVIIFTASIDQNVIIITDQNEKVIAREEISTEWLNIRTEYQDFGTFKLEEGGNKFSWRGLQ